MKGRNATMIEPESSGNKVRRNALFHGSWKTKRKQDVQQREQQDDADDVSALVLLLFVLSLLLVV